jgi:putative addiction module killer protein
VQDTWPAQRHDAIFSANTLHGNDLYQEWLTGLRDRIAMITVIKRVARVEAGLFGDCKFLRDGISELRIDVGAGYRVYYAQVNAEQRAAVTAAKLEAAAREIENLKSTRGKTAIKTTPAKIAKLPKTLEPKQ